MPVPAAPRHFHVTTLGCPKNAVDSEKIAGTLVEAGAVPVGEVGDADLVVLNTCAFVESAREESVEAAFALAGARRPGSRFVLTGCLAERYGPELAEAIPEVDVVVGFGGQSALADHFPDPPAGSEVALGAPRRRPTGVSDLLELPRRKPDLPWAYVKVAEGCDRACAFCAIPSFRGRQVSRDVGAVVREVANLVDDGVAEVVLVAQDIASLGRDKGSPGELSELVRRLDGLGERGLLRQRLLYLYPSEIRGRLLDALLETESVVPYFDLSLQHASRPLLRRMRRFGGRRRFLELLADIRRRAPEAVFRSSFIVGFPGESEQDHDELVAFLDEAGLTWAGFFPFSREDGTPAAGMDGEVPHALVRERIAELAEVQERITIAARHALVGSRIDVLVDGVEDGRVVGRTFREAPEIDGIVDLGPAPGSPMAPAAVVPAVVRGVAGPDLEAEPLVDP